MGTFGSLSTRTFGPTLCGAAAKARAVLTTLAAERLNVSPERLMVAHGVISVAGEPGRRMTFAELAEGVRIAKMATRPAVLRAAGQFHSDGSAHKAARWRRRLPAKPNMPAITTAGAVIANAIFDATGARMLRLPMTPQRVAAALARL